MAQKIERKIVEVGSGKTTAARSTTSAAKKPAAKTAPAKSPAAKKAKAQAVQTHALVTAENKKRAAGKRWGAVILWLVALGFEIAVIMLLNGFFYLPGNKLTYIIIGAVADLICVVLGSQLWKTANDIDPASEKNKFGFFLWNNMGLIASLICFVPLIILILKEKDLDPQTKKIAAAVAIAAALIAGGTSVDWNPTSAEDLAQAQEDAAVYTVDGDVYWTQFGKCYHLDEDCQSLRNSATLYKGTVDEAFEAKRQKPCSFCASEEAIEEVYGERELVSASDIVDDLAA